MGHDDNDDLKKDRKRSSNFIMIKKFEG